jgi:putative transcriptional regulator
MKKSEKTALGVIAAASEVPIYSPSAVKNLIAGLGLNEKAFALLMNVTPVTVRMWITGAARPCGLSRRLMQIYETCPEVIAALVDGKKDSCR